MVWFEQRAGRITSSVIHSILHTNTISPAPSLIKSICSCHPSSASSEAMAWGRAHEKEALTQVTDYTVKQSTSHLDVVISEAGLCLHPEHPHLAASPDGFISCSCCGNGVIEIKCPFRFRGQSVASMLTNPDSFLASDLSLPKAHKYYNQIQHQMFVTGRKYCDFVVWLDPKEICVSRCAYDVSYEQTTVPKLLAFWENHIFPKLTSHVSEKPKTVPESIHCTCGQSDDVDKMVGCDSITCPNEWYHWSCVGLKAKPRGQYWYCPSCKADKLKKARK